MYGQRITRQGEQPGGSYCSPSDPYFVPMHEMIYIFSKTSVKLEGDKENSDITPEEFIAFSNDIWSITGETKD